jgi:transcription-repair coupling factor (superfamily II helicase)
VSTFAHGGKADLNQNLIGRIIKCLVGGQNAVITGLSGSAKSLLLAEVFRNHKGKTLCLVAGEEKAYDFSRDLKGMVGADRVFLFLGRDLVFLKENYTSVETDRILTLQECLCHPRRSGFIIATAASLLYLLLSPGQMQEKNLLLETGMEVERTKIIQNLVRSGFTRVATVFRPGEFAVRGGIIDVFAPNNKKPCRIEFFGDTIDSLRWFDSDSQRSGKREDRVCLSPADELFGEGLLSTLFDYLEPGTGLFIDEPRDFFKSFDRNIRRNQEFVKEARKEKKDIRELAFLQREELVKRISSFPAIYHSFFPGNTPQVQYAVLEHISQREMEPFFNDYEALFLRLRDWSTKGYTIYLAILNKMARDNLSRDLTEHGITGAQFVEYEVERGFLSQSLELVIISERDIWGGRRTAGNKTRRRAHRKEERLLVEDLKIGDYVVHENYGIGIFKGVTKVENAGVTREYILLQYAGTDKLYLPVDKLDLLFKYTASGEKEPRLSKLGGNAWENTKKRVAQSVKDMAQDLLYLYASRNARPGYAFSADTPWQRQFEDDFPYSETPDQLKAINDIKKDMEKSRSMDRLICGDVGYGKTEVAMRAAFKAVMDGKQVAILVPTTVLAEQHYLNFSSRFKEYPTTIEVLSRFRTPARQKEIIHDLQKGVIDIVIGTHRLLSPDIRFKDLGLLIIDEEHRFGVAQKEKIKAIKELVDVISLSATPIPRSLHMALTGLRDLSVIETPPPQRYPITTYVLEYNEEIIAEAIKNEIERDGQVFFVHNRIHDIYEVQEKLKKLLPGVSLGVGHGQMKEDDLARVMMDFLHGKFQVLICTTIIESGLDLPNVNTIIVDEADKMGLAQLYQLRGRVGRSSRMAYAYLTYRPDRVITEDAQKRLNAIREFNELGSGMKIALRDLEIRGAGNILGAEQHGHIQAVGFDMYCRLLEQETAKFRGVTIRAQLQPQLEIDMDYYIPDTYIIDAGAKMRTYRRLLLATDEADIDDIRNELLDRFGPIPQPVENFLQLAALRVLASQKEIRSLRRKGREIEIQLSREISDGFAQVAQGHKIRIRNENTIVLSGDEIKSLDGLKELLENI